MTQPERAAHPEHKAQQNQRARQEAVELPKSVQWSAGRPFQSQTVSEQRDPRTCASAQPDSDVNEQGDSVAARREQIARRSNAFYEERARLNARRDRRTLRIALFIFSVIGLGSAGLATGVMFKDEVPASLAGLIWSNDVTNPASTSGSGSVYMSQQSPAREPETPPLKVVQSDTASSLPTSRVAEVIQPAGTQTPAADKGLLAAQAQVREKPSAPVQVPEQSVSADVSAPAPEVAQPPLQVSTVSQQLQSAPVSAPKPERKVEVLAALDIAALKRPEASIVRKQEPQNQSLMTKAEARSLLQRGDKLMQLGDITSARALYKRAMQSDQTNAAWRLGSTYDPLLFEQMGVRGLRPDAERALKWYLTSAEAGNAQATRAYEALKGFTSN